MIDTFPLDIAVFKAIHGLAGLAPLLDALGVFLALYLPYLLGLALLVFVFKQKTTKQKLGAFLSLALAVVVSRGILTEIIRFVYPITRPFAALNFAPLISESGASFPSGHTAFFFAVAFTLFFAFDKSWGGWFLVLSTLIGVARIFVGVHYPMDILGGIVIGFISYLIVKALVKPGRFNVLAASKSAEIKDAEASPGENAQS